MKTNTYNRREFPKVAGLGAACAAFSIPRDASAGDRRRLPNILFWSAGGHTYTFHFPPRPSRLSPAKA